MTDLGWFQRKQKQTFSNSRRQLTSDAHELEEVTSFNRTYASWSGHEGNAYKVSNTSVMFNVNHGGDKMLLMGLTATHRNLHITGLPPLCEQCDSIGQTKDIMVYARGTTASKTTLRTSLVLIWFDDSPHSNQGLDKIIDSTADHGDQSMKISSFFNTHTHTHTQGYPLVMN